MVNGEKPKPLESTIGRAMIKNVKWKNVIVRLYSIGYFAHFSMCSSWTIRGWQRDGVIPPPVFNVVGARFYSIPEIVGYTQIIRKFPRDRKNLKQAFHIFHTDLKQRLNSINPDDASSIRTLLGAPKAATEIEQNFTISHRDSTSYLNKVMEVLNRADYESAKKQQP